VRCFDFTYYRAAGDEYQVHHEDFYYRTETLTGLAAKYGFTAQLMDDWHDPWTISQAPLTARK